MRVLNKWKNFEFFCGEGTLKNETINNSGLKKLCGYFCIYDLEIISKCKHL